MTLFGTMALMTRPTNTRELAGAVALLVVESDIEGKGTKVAAEKRTGIARSNLYRLFAGDPRATLVLYRRFERAYDLPRFLFDHVMNGDAEWIDECEIDAHMKRFILEGLDELAGNNPKTPKRSRRGA